MNSFSRGTVVAGALLAALGVMPARAQENFDAGKTPAQLYASDCAICHKTPQGLSKGGSIFGLTAFLREHYTASREAAAAIADYLQSVDKGPAAPSKRQDGKRTAKGGEKGKPGETKPGEAKSGEIKSEAPKSTEPKAGEAKSGEVKPDEAKASEPKAASPKAAESKPSEPKSPESKPSDAKTDAPEPAAKDEKPQKKSD